ncbi:hypothetical protein ACWEQ4_01400 [Rhodococcus sp. NPDC003994]
MPPEALTPRTGRPVTREYGVRWPDGRVRPAEPSEIEYWQHQTGFEIVTRVVSDWTATDAATAAA